MAVPTITQISPTSGPAGGRTVVKITGTNFAVPPEPDEYTHWAQTVQVLFNGVASEQVLPYGADFVACVTPPYLDVFPVDDPMIYRVTVDVTLRNLDPTTGLPVDGEEVVKVGGYEYTRRAVTEDDVLKWVSEYVTNHMIRQTIDNVVMLAVHPDYDPNQATVQVEVGKPPALVVTPRSERVQYLGTEEKEAGTATAAKVTDTTTYPVTAGTGILAVRVDREDFPSQRITFAGTETTQTQIAATINAQITGATALVEDGQVAIESDTDGGIGFVQVTANPAANPLLTFPTSEQQGTPEEELRQVGGTWINIAFDVRGVEHKVNKIENLADMLTEFVSRSGSVPVPQTVDDPDSDLLWLPIEMVSEPVFPDVPEGSSLVKEFLATFIVRGIVVGGSEIAALTEDFHSYVGVADVDLDLEKIDG